MPAFDTRTGSEESTWELSMTDADEPRDLRVDVAGKHSRSRPASDAAARVMTWSANSNRLPSRHHAGEPLVECLLVEFQGVRRGVPAYVGASDPLMRDKNW